MGDRTGRGAVMNAGVQRPSAMTLAVLFLLVPVDGAIAHHSSAIYDKEREIRFEGIVSRFEWSNPHVFIHVEGEADGRPATVWQFETSNPSMMRSRGWDRDMLQPGDRIAIGGNPGHNTGAAIALLTFLEKDGVDLLNEDSFFGSSLVSEADAGQSTDSLEGHWVVVPDQALYEVLRPANLDLTEKGKRVVAEYDESTMSPQLRCIPSVAPSYMFIPDLKVIELGNERISFRSEYQEVERIFHLDTDSHEGVSPSLHGHAIARWDGRVLVVDTARFADNRNGHSGGLASGAGKHLVEEFELDPDGRSMTYRFTLEDPDYFSGTVSGQAEYLYSPNREYSPEACSLENAQRLLNPIRVQDGTRL